MKEIQSWEREKIKIWELHKKPNKKRKGSLLKKHTEENSANKLCADLMRCIFIRCSVNTLSMLKCSSKSWNDYINTPSFVHSHLKHSTENAQVLFVKPIFSNLPRSKRCKLQFVSVDMEGKGESNELCTITIPVFSVQCSGMIASSGLACVSSGHDQMYLCNPVMQQLRKLPKCSRTQLFVPSIFGFGYLHSTKEYKVVNFFYTCPAGNIPGLTAPSLFQLRCEVFTFTSLTNGQIWKGTADTPPCHPDSRGLLVKECLYWLGKPRVTATSDRILSFDFEKDIKHFMKTSMLHLWILKDKVSCNWVKEYSINLVSFLPRFIFPVFKAWNEGITFICDDEVLVFYDLKTNCTARSRIGFGVSHDPDLLVFGFEIYHKSLFSL